MARLFYSVLIYLLMPLVVLRLLWRARRAPAYARRWGERFGFGPTLPSGQKVIWVHSVSVGETLAAIPLIRSLQQRYPAARLVVTTMTPTGSERVRAAFGNSVHHVYAPYDLPGAVKRFLRRIEPALAVIMETELWPNTLHACHRNGVPVVLANARLSARSARGYGRVASLVEDMLAKLMVVAAQSRDDGQRFLTLGLEPARLQVIGNIKFDLEIDDEQRRRASALAAQWRGGAARPVWLVASTHQGEDALVLDAFNQVLRQYPDTLLVLVPRHPERFSEVAGLCRARGFGLVRRSIGAAPSATDQILLGDTMGELADFFGACDVAFVGGSLVAAGGHNLIEPAAWGVPVLSGPSLFNFSEMATLLQAAGGMAVCSSAAELAAAVEQLLNDPQRRMAMGKSAQGVAEANRGAMARLLDVIERLWVR